MLSFQGNDSSQILAESRSIGRRLVAARPAELAVGNMVRRVLGLIRDELQANRSHDITSKRQSFSHSGQQAQPNANLPPFGHVAQASTKGQASHQVKDENALETPMLELLTTSQHERRPVQDAAKGNDAVMTEQGSYVVDDSLTSDALVDQKQEIVEGIGELLDEIRQVDDQIAAYAAEHTHSHDIILTNSVSKGTTRYFLKAASKRKFEILLTESYPNNHDTILGVLDGRRKHGQKASENVNKTLGTAGINVVLAPDSAGFALMERANRVVLAAEAVLADEAVCAHQVQKP